MYEEDITQHEHESYGIASISMVSGGSTNLFGSSIQHSQRIRMRISRAKRDRHLHEDWYHAGERLLEFEMSPAQFTEMITSPGRGDGTPVTLVRVFGKPMEDCPSSTTRAEFDAEFNKTVKQSTTHVAHLARLADSLLEKGAKWKAADRTELHNVISKLVQEIRSNIPFIVTQFNEALEKTTTEAKGEIEQFFSSKVHQLGLSALENELKKLLVNQEPLTRIEDAPES